MPAELLGGASVSLRVGDVENVRVEVMMRDDEGALHVAGAGDNSCLEVALDAARWRVDRRDMVNGQSSQY